MTSIRPLAYRRLLLSGGIRKAPRRFARIVLMSVRPVVRSSLGCNDGAPPGCRKLACTRQLSGNPFNLLPNSTIYEPS